MKGVVFAVFKEMLETTFGEDYFDDLVDATNPPSGGAYTTVGTYDHAELVAMVMEMSRRTGIAPPQLIQAFGKYMWGYFVEHFPQFFEFDDAFSFLSQLDSFHQLEVMKLYSDATVPRFQAEVSEDGSSMHLDYFSPRHFADVAVGMMSGAFEHWNEDVSVEMIDMSEGDEQRIRFLLTRN